MSSWFTSLGTLHHGFGGRWKLGSLAPAEEFDEAVTKAQLDTVGQGFPFTGDATIDGTLNIDFTDTLSFYSGDSLELENDPIVQGITKGDMIGIIYKEGDDELFSGVVDGVNEIFGGLAEIGLKVHTMGFKDLDTGDLVVANIGKLAYPAELGGGQSIFISPMQAVFIESDGSSTEYVLRAEREVGTDDTQLQFGKVSEDTDENVSGALLDMDNTMTGMRTRSLNPDPEASVHRFENEEGDSILDLINEAIQSDVLLANDFADDAAAATGDVPVGGLYHNAGALRIRIA